MVKQLPNVSDFATLIENNRIYVAKTDFLAKIVDEVGLFFSFVQEALANQY